MSLIPSGFFGRTSNIFDPLSLDIWDPFQDLPFPKADLPGLRKDEAKVEIEEGNVLRISGERRREVEERSDTWHCLERSNGQFLRGFRLPENASIDQVKASTEYDNCA